MCPHPDSVDFFIVRFASHKAGIGPLLTLIIHFLRLLGTLWANCDHRDVEMLPIGII